jgi:diguanylate cyclase (GGDEF)-like protein
MGTEDALAYGSQGPAGPAMPATDALRAGDLTELLACCRELSNLLDEADLCAALGKALAGKFGFESLAVYTCEGKGSAFRRAFVQGPVGFPASLSGQEPPPAGPGTADDPAGPLEGGGGRAGGTQWVPLNMRRENIGLLALHSRAGRPPLDAQERYFLQQLASHAAVCLNTCRLYAQRQREKEGLDKTLQNLSLLYSIGKAINFISDLKKLLQYIMSQAIEITAAEKGSIMLYDMESDRLNIRVLAGLEDDAFQEKVNNSEIRCRSFRPGEGIAGRVFLTAKPIVVNNIREDDLFVGSETSFVRSIACIPMVVYNEPIGVINVTNSRRGEGFTAEDLDMLKAVADQAAVAVNKAQLWHMAVTDSLTGLYVRRYFMMKLQDEIHRAERYNKRLSVIMADLDHFKTVNDTYGHAAGDRVLQAIGQHLRRNIRDIDVLARYGGEEFVFLLPDTDRNAAFSLSERLRKGLEQLRVDDLPTPTLSLGIAGYPEDAARPDELILRADTALYAAKQAGRNSVVTYSPQIRPAPPPGLSSGR